MNEHLRRRDDYDNGEAPRSLDMGRGAPGEAAELGGERGEYAPRRERHPKQPWYNQRWMLALTLLIGLGVLAVAVSGLTQEVAGVSASVQEQTEAIEEQTSVIAGVQRAVEDLTDAVALGVERIVDEIRSVAGRG
ncbi:hypothetical protein MO973_42775 [Paenibacillus sp. TRM 82003]|nr:hypothetical protein [Paenibacillus sp. TRM 82003]